jgi:hypothetical protein
MSRLSSLGVTIGYGFSGSVTTKPSTMKILDEIKSIPGVKLDTEKIDVSVLADTIKQYAAGQQDTGGSFDPVFAISDDKSIPQIKQLYGEAATAKANDQYMWLEIVIPGLNDGFWLIVETAGNTIPLPDIGVNSALEISPSFVIQKYVGLSTKVTLGENTAGQTTQSGG